VRALDDPHARAESRAGGSEEPTLHRSPITTKENYIMNDAEKNAETV
jgi:hypothetical protein